MSARLAFVACALALVACGAPSSAGGGLDDAPTGPGEVLGSAIGRSVTITLRDGTVIEGELSAVGRSDQWGAAQWYPTLAIDVEAGGDLQTIGLDRVAAFTSRSGGVIDGAIHCDYDEGGPTVSVWCRVITPMAVELVQPPDDGGRLMVDDTYVWRFEVDGADEPLDRPLGAIFVRAASTLTSVEQLIGSAEARQLQAGLREELRRRWLAGIETLRFAP